MSHYCYQIHQQNYTKLTCNGRKLRRTSKMLIHPFDKSVATCEAWNEINSDQFFFLKCSLRTYVLREKLGINWMPEKKW